MNVYDQNFRGEGMVDGEGGVAVKDGSSGLWRVILKESLQKHLKTRWVKVSCS